MNCHHDQSAATAHDEAHAEITPMRKRPRPIDTSLPAPSAGTAHAAQHEEPNGCASIKIYPFVINPDSLATSTFWCQLLLVRTQSMATVLVVDPAFPLPDGMLEHLQTMGDPSDPYNVCKIVYEDLRSNESKNRASSAIVALGNQLRDLYSSSGRTRCKE
jgi:hypothetical protein